MRLTVQAAEPEMVSGTVAPAAIYDTLPGDESSEAEKIFVAVAQAVEQRDLHTASHCERVAFIGVAMGMVAGLERENLLIVHRGGYMHDIGKVGIPDSILFKTGKLTAKEWEV